MIKRIISLVEKALVAAFYVVLMASLTIAVLAAITSLAFRDVDLALIYLAGCGVYLVLWTAKRNAHRTPTWLHSDAKKHRTHPSFGAAFLGVTCLGTGFGLIVATIVHCMENTPWLPWCYLGFFSLVCPIIIEMMHRMFGEPLLDD